MSSLTRRIVREELDSAADNSFNGVYDHDAQSEWLASKLNKPIDESVDDVNADPPMFQTSADSTPKNGI